MGLKVAYNKYARSGSGPGNEASTCVYFRIPVNILRIGKQPTDSTQSYTTINKPLLQSNNSYVVALSIWEQTIGASVNLPGNTALQLERRQ